MSSDPRLCTCWIGAVYEEPLAVDFKRSVRLA